MRCVSLRGFPEEFHTISWCPHVVSVFSAELGSTADTCLHLSTELWRFAVFSAMLGSTADTSSSTIEAGFAVDSRTSRCVSSCRQAKDALHHGRYGPEGVFTGSGLSRLVLLVFFTSRCVPCCRSQALMRCIVAGYRQKYSYALGSGCTCRFCW